MLSKICISQQQINKHGNIGGRKLSLGLIFKYRCGGLHMTYSTFTAAKQPNLKLKTLPRIHMGSHLLGAT